mmetsp:Transcript_89832/g.253342  ORF Transcript_89832/g.253342 Transcript_89832/m.253342 type:complete len:203 (-) Transcript_89832:364-972(-)
MPHFTLRFSEPASAPVDTTTRVLDLQPVGVTLHVANWLHLSAFMQTVMYIPAGLIPNFNFVAHAAVSHKHHATPGLGVQVAPPHVQEPLMVTLRHGDRDPRGIVFRRGIHRFHHRARGQLEEGFSFYARVHRNPLPFRNKLDTAPTVLDLFLQRRLGALPSVCEGRVQQPHGAAVQHREKRSLNGPHVVALRRPQDQPVVGK